MHCNRGRVRPSQAGRRSGEGLDAPRSVAAVLEPSGSKAEAKEAVLDVFVEVSRGIERFCFEKPFENWLRVIELSTCRRAVTAPA